MNEAAPTGPELDWRSGLAELAPRLRGVRRLGLQVPEGLRVRAAEIVAMLRELTGAEVLLWGEPTFGACDLADRPLAELGVEELVHLGHLPLPGLAERCALPVHFVPVRHTGALVLPDATLTELRRRLPSRLGVVTTAQHLHLLDELREALGAAGFTVAVGKGGPRIAAPGQLLGCIVAAARAADGDALLYLGTGRFHPLTVALATGLPVTTLDPHTGAVDDVDADRFLRQRHAAITAARDAQRWAVLLSSQAGQARLPLARRAAGWLRDHGREALLVAATHQHPDQLAGLGVAAAVNTACPRIAIDEGAGWPVPLLTLPELEVLLDRRPWEPYPFDEFP